MGSEDAVDPLGGPRNFGWRYRWSVWKNYIFYVFGFGISFWNIFNIEYWISWGTWKDNLRCICIYIKHIGTFASKRKRGKEKKRKELNNLLSDLGPFPFSTQYSDI